MWDASADDIEEAIRIRKQAEAQETRKKIEPGVLEIWTVLDFVKDPSGNIDKDQYVTLNLKLAKVILTLNSLFA